MKIRRWRYTKFAKIWALPEGAHKKFLGSLSLDMAALPQTCL